MDINELFLSCRKGDLGRVKYLVEQKEVEVNIRDKWDSTPLYYACLCGHLEVVQYLLENGARCEANTFDGERCLYGALNTEIRNLLKNLKVVTAKSLRRDCYDEFLRRCLEYGEYHDISFDVHGEIFHAHRCILSVRCDNFHEMLLNRWKQKITIFLNNSRITVAAFKAILQYLYTGRLEIHIDYLDDCIMLARQCCLFDLIDEIEETVKKVKSFECTKPGTNITNLLIEPQSGSTELQQDFMMLAEQALPPELCNWVGGNELPFLPNLGQSQFADLCFTVQGHHFFCHKIFFCGRSDFFKALLADHFCETTTFGEEDIPVFALHDISVEVFVCILYYIYQNTAELSPSNVFDVLYAADIYLLPGLKRLCANIIGQHLDSSNVVAILRTSRLLELPRLEDQCAEFMAKHLEQVVDNIEFQALVQEDALDVKQRQETDSISIIDDVRYHITSNVQTFSAMEDANDKLIIIDKLLEKLGLDA